MRNEDDNNAIHHNWRTFSGMDNQKFDDYISVNGHLVINSVNMVEELCKSHVAAMNVEVVEEEGEDGQPEPKVMPKHTKCS
jgi:hypothetical protein